MKNINWKQHFVFWGISEYFIFILAWKKSVFLAYTFNPQMKNTTYSSFNKTLFTGGIEFGYKANSLEKSCVKVSL